MSQKINNIPSPEVLMNSMRSLGYSFKTAIADIIDNSISAFAKNIYITLPISNEKIFITILDDGYGMNDNELFNAMKYGSSKELYNSNDLGRFGLGLKSASLSQCRILTVASKHDGIINAYQWDLNRVICDKEWVCLKLTADEISNLPEIDSLNSLKTGTLVIWENFDIAYKTSGGYVREYLSDEMEETRKHLELTFHRFLNNKFRPIKIYINKDPLIGMDPFLEYHPKTDTRDPSELNIDGSIIKVQPFILPHQSDLSSKDIDSLGGMDNLRKGQGFYIYRNERLIVYGTWFRLSKSHLSNELFKYGRIKVDIPNSLDEEWKIDIKKQNAIIPKQIVNNLQQIVSGVCDKSKSKSAKRTKLTFEKDNTKIWNKMLARDNKDLFYINTDCEFIKNFIDDFDDKDKSKIIRLLDVIGSSLPLNDIYNSICNKNAFDEVTDDVFDTLVTLCYQQFKFLKSKLQLPNEKIYEMLSSMEPFNKSIIIDKVKEIIEHEKY